MQDVEKTLLKIPKKHRDLIKNYKFSCECGNTLKNDKDHIGYIDEEKKKIVVTAPWHYSREMAVLHEVAHAVFKAFMTPELKEKWSKILKNTKNKQKQNDEELFCMNYAATYCKHPPVIHYHPEWVKFIKDLPQ